MITTQIWEFAEAVITSTKDAPRALKSQKKSDVQAAWVMIFTCRPVSATSAFFSTRTAWSAQARTNALPAHLQVSTSILLQELANYVALSWIAANNVLQKPPALNVSTTTSLTLQTSARNALPFLITASCASRRTLALNAKTITSQTSVENAKRAASSFHTVLHASMITVVINVSRLIMLTKLTNVPGAMSQSLTASTASQGQFVRSAKWGTISVRTGLLASHVV